MRRNWITDCNLRHSLPQRPRSFWSHQESRPLTRSNTGSPRFTDFPSLCACSESSLANLIGSGLDLLYLKIHSKPKYRWTWPEVAILGADQKERGLWGGEWSAIVLALATPHSLFWRSVDNVVVYCKVFSPFLWFTGFFFLTTHNEVPFWCLLLKLFLRRNSTMNIPEAEKYASTSRSKKSTR